MPAILIYFPCISKSITFPLSTFVTRLLERGHEVTFATSYVLNNEAVTHVEVGAGIRLYLKTTSNVGYNVSSLQALG